MKMTAVTLIFCSYPSQENQIHTQLFHNLGPIAYAELTPRWWSTVTPLFMFHKMRPLSYHQHGDVFPSLDKKISYEITLLALLSLTIPYKLKRAKYVNPQLIFLKRLFYKIVKFSLVENKEKNILFLTYWVKSFIKIFCIFVKKYLTKLNLCCILEL